ncbi:protein phosphatase PTC7 [Acrasis kona]|uniref:Protein phosphatase n=1 Tax=Acrasis kona TaxID=1008807 RepID=A0AAW2YSA8_9EUKA
MLRFGLRTLNTVRINGIRMYARDLSVKVGVAYQGKYKKPNILKEDGTPDCGEDAYYCETDPSKYSGKEKMIASIGMADGVGGYTEVGVDPSVFAWKIMEYTKQKTLEDSLIDDPRTALEEAHQKVISEKLIPAGGCTVSVANMFYPEGSDQLFMQYTNLGDSSIMVVRDGKILFKSQEQTHFFNCPYQLSIPSNGESIFDSAKEKADSFDQGQNLELLEGDYVVVATDGLWDNLFTDQILTIIKAVQEDESSVSQQEIIELTAFLLLRNTLLVACSTKYQTPFSAYAKSHMIRHAGGKYDDITIAVAKIVKE